MQKIRFSLFVAVAVAATPLSVQANQLCGLVVGGQGTGVLFETGADWARVPLYWNVVEDSEGHYYDGGFAEVDKVVANAANTMVSVEAFPAYLGTGDSYRTACASADWQHVLDRWRAFWQIATSRYCASNPANHGVVRHWSVWNEPNAWWFLKPRLECSSSAGPGYCDPKNPSYVPSRKDACQWSAAQDYADLVRYANLGLQAGCPGASLVAGEIAQDDYERTFSNWFLGLLKNNGITPAVYSVHTYDTAAGTVNQVAGYRSVLNGLQIYPAIWVTEAGGPAPGLPVATCRANGWNPQDQSCWGNQASFLQDMFRLNQQNASAYNWPRTFIFRAQVFNDPTDEYGVALINSGQVTPTLSTALMRGVCVGCGEATCVPAQGAYISHFTGLGCTGIESYYLPYDGYGYQCRTWDGNGRCGTIRRTMTNQSYRYNGQCYDQWPGGNQLENFVTVYR